MAARCAVTAHYSFLARWNVGCAQTRSPMNAMMIQLLAALLVFCLYACESTDEISQLRKFAEVGNATAQYNLAQRLSSGEDAKRDYPQAIEWCRKAAAQRGAESAFNLGELYRSGVAGGPKDEVLTQIFENGELGQPKDLAKGTSVRGITPTCGF